MRLLAKQPGGKRAGLTCWRACSSPCSTSSRTRASSSSRAPSFLGLIGGPNSFFGITPEAFGAIGALVNFGVAFLVDKVTKEPPEHIQHLVESVRTPRGAKAVDGAN
ncbi:MAG: hypothetical protein WCF44_04985 [Candidatus Methylophosphatis roskildensis]